MKTTRQILLLSLAMLTVPPLAAEDGPHWSYQGADGPDHWGELSPDFVQCRVGLNQSPINIVDTVEADLPPLHLEYPGYTTELINNGHTVQANVEPGNFLKVGNESFELLQFHVHTPSEHRVDGKIFLMELHFVHSNAAGELAVVALLIDEGEATHQMQTYTSKLPAKLHQPVPYRQALSELPPVDLSENAYYRYNGSLTTPPCSEGVRWFVLKDTLTTTQEVQKFYQNLIGDDARGPQPVNARVILR